MKFDLISDLHNNFWPEESRINWEGLGTSLLAIILGDINSDINDTYKTVVDISKHYKYVIFIDGNHEHNNHCGIQQRNTAMRNMFKKYQNIQYLNRSAIVIDGVAFVGTNGWWTFDFMEPEIDKEEAYMYFINNNIFSDPFMQELWLAAKDDAIVLGEIIQKLNVDASIKEIVMLTHTAPIKHFCDFENEYKHPAHFSRCGNSFLLDSLKLDSNKKVKTWCFGHVHKDFDQTIDGVRFVCHPRGRQDDSPQNLFYFPKIIELKH